MTDGIVWDEICGAHLVRFVFLGGLAKYIAAIGRTA